jgi:UDP-N-acetyl-2-amino-2-deoxyglucuronate dehydrogenase
MLTWIFGNVKKNVVHISQNNKAAGYLELEKARVRWFLSVDKNDIPVKIKENGQRTFRSIKLEGKEIEFSDGFTDLHTISYQKILRGKGFCLEDAKKSIETVYAIRNTEPIGLKGEYHPICRNIS